MTPTELDVHPDPGSFRDPTGCVVHAGAAIYRLIKAPARDQVASLVASGLWDRWAREGRAIAAHVCPPETEAALRPRFADVAADVVAVVEHDRVPLISYPYEWPPALLRQAALLQLDLLAEALTHGFVFSDASAYNIQFVRGRPLFIDFLSVRPYRDGELWEGYRQFCRQFLNPLLLASRGIPFARWYRGAMEGIDTEDLAKALPLRSYLSFRCLMHVHLHARFEAAAVRKSPDIRSRARMSRNALLAMVRSLRAWCGDLDTRQTTVWSRYDPVASYRDDGLQIKEQFVRDFIAAARPRLLLDVGCNTGEFAQLALEGGATSVVGIDFDTGALNAAVERAKAHDLDFLPLCIDAADPSPAQGWRGQERSSFVDRTSDVDAVLALAVLHHLVIGRNIPLHSAVEWIVQRARHGVIEFVPKEDHRVQDMLRNRADIFPDYDTERFRSALARVARIDDERRLPGSGRLLVRYSREG